MTAVSRWAYDLALGWFCFLFPLVEPDKRISRIRLSEQTHDGPCNAACNF